MLIKAERPERAVEIFTELKNYDEAKRYSKFMKHTGNLDRLLKDQAEWIKETGDWRMAADLFIKGKDYTQAIHLYEKNQDMKSLVELCRTLDKNENRKEIEQCVKLFQQYKAVSYAKEAFLKMGDMKGLLDLYIQNDNWNEAFIIAK